MSQSHPYAFGNREWVRRKVNGRVGVVVARSNREGRTSDQFCVLSVNGDGEPKEEWIDEYELEAAPADQHPFPDPFVSQQQAE